MRPLTRSAACPAASSCAAPAAGLLVGSLGLHGTVAQGAAGGGAGPRRPPAPPGGPRRAEREPRCQSNPGAASAR